MLEDGLCGSHRGTLKEQLVCQIWITAGIIFDLLFDQNLYNFVLGDKPLGMTPRILELIFEIYDKFRDF